MASPALLADIKRVIEVYEYVIGYRATYTHQMISNLGPVEALSKLVKSPDLQRGFKILRDRDLLQSAFEAVVVRHAGEFQPGVVAAARFRLEHPHDLL